MRNLGGFAAPEFPNWPDYIVTAMPTSVGSIATFDYPAASTVNSSSPHYVEVVTAGINAWFAPNSTGANAFPAANLTGGSSQSVVSNASPLRIGLPANSTGGSIAFPTTNGGASLKFWRK